MPKQHFVKKLLINKSFRRLVEQAPIFLSFSFIFFSLLISQTPYEDDFLEDEWLKPLLP